MRAVGTSAELITRRELAVLLNVALRTVDSWAASGRLPESVRW